MTDQVSDHSFMKEWLLFLRLSSEWARDCHIILLGCHGAKGHFVKKERRIDGTYTLSQRLQEAFEAFQRASDLAELQAAVARWPLMTDASFMASIEQAIQTQVPPQQRPAWQQRLAWLREIGQNR